ncbi:MAG: hypothetical protein ACOCUL_02855 [Bacteroidota bacterium]
MKVLTLSEPNEHVFFGYYDMSPFNNDDTKVLAVKTNHPLKTPAISSYIKIGYFEVGHNIASRSTFIEVGESKAWCWQQGSRLQWYPRAKQSENIFYNTVENDKYIGVVQNILSKEILFKTPIPLYDISNDGTKGLSLNFSRLQRLRPGYGYTSLPDLTVNENIPQDEGVFGYDFTTKKHRLLVSFDDILKVGNLPPGWHEYQHYINHLSFNPSGTEFMFLHLFVHNSKRLSRLLVSKADGTNLRVLNDISKVSHYAWKDDNYLLCFSQSDENTPMRYVEYNIHTGDRNELAPNILTKDGHPTYINSNTVLMTDTYPNIFGYQCLILFDTVKNKFKKKMYFHRSFKFNGEVRTDLHPRTNISEDMICIDDEYKGYKAMKVIRLDADGQ